MGRDVIARGRAPWAVLVVVAGTSISGCGGRWHTAASATSAVTPTAVPATAALTSTAGPTSTVSTPSASTLSPSTAATVSPATTELPATIVPATTVTGTGSDQTTSSTSGDRPATAPTGSDAVATITANWERFFAPTTSVDDRIALLQHGEALRQALTQRAADPLMREASAKVRSVQVESGGTASVTYDVQLSGTTVLTASKGTAVFEDGTWKVSADSFCALASLGAPTALPGC